MKDDDTDELWEDDEEGEVWTAPASHAVGPGTGDGNGMQLMPVAIGVVGVLMGGMALFLNFGDSSQIDVTRGAVLEAANKMDAVEGHLQGLDDRLTVLEKRMDAFEATQERLAEDTDRLARETQRAFDRFGEEVQRNRVLIDGLRSGSPGAVARSSAPPRNAADSSEPNQPAPVREAPETAREPESTAGDSDQRVHTVQSGDILWNLARRYDVSVDALIVANPGIDPDRLRPGMKLVIPEP
ncbi:MAG: LysM peptidoglycan-binding domain-containing protein [Opitutales bacterium]